MVSLGRSPRVAQRGPFTEEILRCGLSGRLVEKVMELGNDLVGLSDVLQQGRPHVSCRRLAKILEMLEGFRGPF